jgi:hypothetical protein
MKVEIPDLTSKEAGEIVITAAEGGIGYWSQIESYQYERWIPDTPDGYVGDPIDVPDDFVFYTIREDINDNGEYEGKPVDITPALLRRGFEAAYKAPKDKGGWMAQNLVASVAREDWTGEIDSDGADMIVQFGVFGELRYG